MNETPRREPDGPVAQSVRIGFRVLQAAVVLLGVGWAASNIRQVPPDSQAVVLRFGEVVRVRPAGLVLALPRPFELVELLPGPDRPLDQRVVAGVPLTKAIIDPASRAAGEVPPDSVGLYLTGDGGVVLLDATLTYRITSAREYQLQAAHVAPALRRLFLASATVIGAGQAVDTFVVAQAAQDAAMQGRREALRGALTRQVNRRLESLAEQGAGLGVEVTRVDLTALLPPAAKFAFDEVLNATQMADQGLAAARTDAARTRQAADQERDRIVAAARASADERVGTARVQAASITALRQRMATGVGATGVRASLIEQLYRERIAAILREAGSVNTVDASNGARVILPGTQP